MDYPKYDEWVYIAAYTHDKEQKMLEGLTFHTALELVKDRPIKESLYFVGSAYKVEEDAKQELVQKMRRLLRAIVESVRSSTRMRVYRPPLPTVIENTILKYPAPTWNYLKIKVNYATGEVGDYEEISESEINLLMSGDINAEKKRHYDECFSILDCLIKCATVARVHGILSDELWKVILYCRHPFLLSLMNEAVNGTDPMSMNNMAHERIHKEGNSKNEIMQYKLISEGVFMIQSGQNPKEVEHRLLGFLLTGFYEDINAISETHSSLSSMGDAYALICKKLRKEEKTT